MSAVSTERLQDVESEFPVLRNRTFNGHRLVYLDSAATSQTPQPVIDAMTRYYTESRASIHRGVYPLAVEATELFEAGREKAAAWLRWDPDCTVFTRNATEAINMVAATWGRANVVPGDRRRRSSRRTPRPRSTSWRTRGGGATCTGETSWC